MSSSTKKRRKRRFLASFLPKRGDRPGEVLRKLLFWLALIVLMVSLGILICDFSSRYHSDQNASSTAALYERNPSSLSSEAQQVELPEGYQQKFAQLYLENPDIKGFIEIEGTNLSYPVVQTTDNDYYLYRNLQRTYDIYGVPFLDYRCSLNLEHTSTNLVIYGHHINGKRVFGQLTNYKELEFYQQHPLVQFDTVYGDGDWKIVSVFVTNIHPEQDNGQVFEYHNYLEMDQAQFEEYIQEVRDRSYIDTGVDVVYGDQLLTLSTCSYEFDDARTVLVARKVREGESSEVDVSLAAVNEDAKYPAVYQP